MLASKACLIFLALHIARLAELVFGFFPFDLLRDVESFLPARDDELFVPARDDDSFVPARGGVKIFRAPGESGKFYLIIIYGS